MRLKTYKLSGRAVKRAALGLGLIMLMVYISSYLPRCSAGGYVLTQSGEFRLGGKSALSDLEQWSPEGCWWQPHFKNASRRYGTRSNSYLSLFHVGAIHGLHVEGNDISTQAGDSDIYVTASRHKQPGDFPIKRVTVVKNITPTNGIRVQGWPAEKVVVQDNRHLGAKPGKLIDEASAELANNANYEARSVPPLSLKKDNR